MNNGLCRLYGITTLDGLKAICGSKALSMHINMLEITQVSEDIFGFETYGIDYFAVALQIVAKLKEFSYHECIVIDGDDLKIIGTFSSDGLKYLDVKTSVMVVDDSHDEVDMALTPFALEELGIPNVKIPSMFKKVNSEDDCPLESADIVDLTSKE